MIGQTINNYCIERKLGEGGMSEVFFARHNRIDRTVAIKVLHQNLFSNEQVRNRFKNEANALIKLEHPNILKIYDYIEQENLACLIVEYIDGISLDTFINKFSGPLPELKAIGLFNKILDAVHYAHENNILHRDIKPGNIMIGKDGRSVKVMDFGIAKFTDTTSPKVTHLNSQLGTPYYMSPEQIKGLPYTSQSDIYSLGVTLFEMATGKCPYIGISTLFELQTKIVNDPLPPTSLYYPDVSATLQEAIKIATNKDAQHRFGSCHEFKDFLQKGKGSAGVSQSGEEFIKTQQRSLQKTMILQEDKPVTKSKSKKTLWAIASVLIVIGAIAAGLLIKDSSSLADNKKIVNDSLLKNDHQNVPIKPEENKALFSKKADSLIAFHESNTRTMMKDVGKRAELKTKLINAIEINAIDSFTRIIQSYNKYFLVPGNTNPSTVNTSAPVVVLPPSRSTVLSDLSIQPLSNGVHFSNANIDNYSPGNFDKTRPPAKWAANIRFKRNDTTYQATLNYEKDGNNYKYSSNTCSAISFPVEVKTDPSPSAATIRNDIIRYFKREKKLCGIRFTDEKEISDVSVMQKTEDGFLNISYQVQFMFKDQAFSGTVSYQVGHGDNTDSKPKYVFLKIRLNKC